MPEVDEFVVNALVHVSLIISSCGSYVIYKFISMEDMVDEHLRQNVSFHPAVSILFTSSSQRFVESKDTYALLVA